MITLVRVDNRLIHGQVVEAWLPHLKVQRVVVADDEAASSPLIRAAMALAGIEMALAGVGFPIPVDEVVDTMGKIGREMDVRYRETAGGGLAATPTGRRLAKERLVQLKPRPS